MNLAVIVPTINNLKYLKLLIDSLPHQGETVIVIDQASVDETPQWLAAHQGLITLTQEKNIGVAQAWNLGILSALHLGATHIAVLNNDIVLAPQALDQLVAWQRRGVGVPTVKPIVSTTPPPIDWEAHPTQDWISRPGDFCGFLMTRDVVEAVGWFDEAYQIAYCVTPETPVLTADFYWRPIGEIQVGTWLIGVDELPVKLESKTQAVRRYRYTQVLATQPRLARCRRIRLADGRDVICSLDHQWWANQTPTTTMPSRWLRAQGLCVGDAIAAPFQVWHHTGTAQETQLARLCDQDMRLESTEEICRLSINRECGADVLDDIEKLLQHFSISYRTDLHSYGTRRGITVSDRHQVFRVLGQARALGLLRQLQVDGLKVLPNTKSFYQKIIEIEDVGTREVIALETTTKTYLANGMIAHNCEDLDFEMRLLRAGIPHGMCHDALVYHFGSRSILEGGVTDRRPFQDNAKRFERKWGIHHEIARRMIAREGPPVLG